MSLSGMRCDRCTGKESKPMTEIIKSAVCRKCAGELVAKLLAYIKDFDAEYGKDKIRRQKRLQAPHAELPGNGSGHSKPNRQEWLQHMLEVRASNQPVFQHITRGWSTKDLDYLNFELDQLQQSKTGSV